jgi:hypothetical protein
MIGSSIVSSTEDGLDKLAKHARVVLVVVAVVQLAGSTILYAAGGIPDLSMFAVQLVIGASFVGLTLWARKDPLTAVLFGLGIYATPILVAAIADPSTLLTGLVAKAIIAVMFANGISTGLTYNTLKRSLGPGGARRP